jgi:ABC-type polysaccharide/polyol phosphate transport system ATPase subunit
LERLCDRGMWLEHGRVMKIGKVSEVLKAYRESATAQAPVAAQTS